MPAEPRVAVVTGASRGAGRGIAIALGTHGYDVYVTGRTQRPGQSALGGTIHETAEAVSAAGGHGIAVAVDHREDTQVAALFDQIRSDSRRLDLLVNNAAPGAVHYQYGPAYGAHKAALDKLPPTWPSITGRFNPVQYAGTLKLSTGV